MVLKVMRRFLFFNYNLIIVSIRVGRKTNVSNIIIWIISI